MLSIRCWFAINKARWIEEWFFMPMLNTWLFVRTFSVITHTSQSVSLSRSCSPDPDRMEPVWLTERCVCQTWFSLDRAGLTHRVLRLSDVGEMLSLALHQLHHTPLSLHVTNTPRVSRREVAPGQNCIVQSQKHRQTSSAFTSRCVITLRNTSKWTL